MKVKELLDLVVTEDELNNENYTDYAGDVVAHVVWLLASSSEVHNLDGGPYFTREAWDRRLY